MGNKGTCFKNGNGTIVREGRRNDDRVNPPPDSDSRIADRDCTIAGLIMGTGQFASR